MKVKTFKKIFTIILASTLIFVIIATPVNAATKEPMIPYYNNVDSANSTVTISSNGTITINNRYTGTQSVTTKAVITTYIEKKTLGIFWIRVDIGQTNDEWVDTVYNYYYSGSHSTQLSSSGTYRVNVEYVIYGSGGSADTITRQIEKSY